MIENLLAKIFRLGIAYKGTVLRVFIIEAIEDMATTQG